MLPNGPALFGRVPQQPQRQGVPKKSRPPVDNEIKIQALHSLAAIVEDCRRRSLAWSIRLLHEREKAVLTRRIALNKLMRIVNERVRQNQTKFMEVVFAAAAEGDFELEDLLKSSQRNSLSNESRFSTLWRNLNNSIVNRASNASNSGNNLKGLDAFLQKVLDKANTSQDNGRDGDLSMISSIDPFKEMTRLDGLILATDRYSVGMQEIVADDDFMTRVEKQAFNEQAVKTENMFTKQKAKEGQKIERLLLLERQFTQMARILKGLQVRKLLIGFSAIMNAPSIRASPEPVDDLVSFSDDRYEREGFAFKPKHVDDLLESKTGVLGGLLHSLVSNTLLQTFCSIAGHAVDNIEDEDEGEVADLLAFGDQDEMADHSVIELESVQRTYNSGVPRVSASAIDPKTAAFGSMLTSMVMRKKQEALVTLFEHIFEREERRLVVAQAVEVLCGVVTRYQADSAFTALRSEVESQRLGERQTEGVLTIANILAVTAARNALRMIQKESRRQSGIRLGLKTVVELMKIENLKSKASVFQTIKAEYTRYRVTRGLKSVAILFDRSEIMNSGISLAAIFSVGKASRKCCDLFTKYHQEVSERLVHGLASALIEAEYSKRKRLQEYDLDCDIQKMAAEDDEYLQKDYALEFKQTKKTSVRSRKTQCIARVRRPYSSLALFAAKLEFTNICSAFSRIKVKAISQAKREAGLQAVATWLHKSVNRNKRETLATIRKFEWSKHAKVLAGKLFESSVSMSSYQPDIVKVKTKVAARKPNQVPLISSHPNSQIQKLSGKALDRDHKSKKMIAMPREKSSIKFENRGYTLTTASHAKRSEDVQPKIQEVDVPILLKKKVLRKEWPEENALRNTIYSRYKLSTRLLEWEKLTSEQQQEPVRETAFFGQSSTNLLANSPTLSHKQTPEVKQVNPNLTNYFSTEHAQTAKKFDENSPFKVYEEEEALTAYKTTYPKAFTQSSATLKRRASPITIREDHLVASYSRARNLYQSAHESETIAYRPRSRPAASALHCHDHVCCNAAPICRVVRSRMRQWTDDRCHGCQHLHSVAAITKPCCYCR